MEDFIQALLRSGYMETLRGYSNEIATAKIIELAKLLADQVEREVPLDPPSTKSV